MRKIILSVCPLFFISFSSFSQWNANPAVNTPVSTALVDQKSQKMVSDTKGGAIIAWEDFRGSVPAGVADIFVQRIDKNGYVKWTVDGVNICSDINDQGTINITEDGFGGAIISWNDHRAGKRDVYAQRIDSSGNMKWTSNGVLASGNGKLYDQRDSKLISDGNGGAILVWQDSVPNSEWDIKAQRISGTNGASMWTAAGVPICTSVLSQIRPRLRTDGAGGAIIVWQDKRNGANSNIYAQRVNASGIIQWAVNGVSVRLLSFYAAKNPLIESDGAGGAIIVWEDKRPDSSHPGDTTSDIYAQRVNASGAMQWIANGVKVCTAFQSQAYLDMTTAGISGAIIVWKDKRYYTTTMYDVYAQKIDMNGVALWTTNGVAISALPFNQGAPSIIGDGLGGAIIAYQDSSGGTENIYSTKINSLGVIQWTSPVGTAAGNQTAPRAVSDGAGGCLYSFQDQRNVGSIDIYAQYLNLNGIPDGIQDENNRISSKCFPNPFTKQTTIEINNSELEILDFKITIHDIYGKEVHPFVTRSSDKFVIYRDDLANGIYFYEIKSSSKTLSNGTLILTN